MTEQSAALPPRPSDMRRPLPEAFTTTPVRRRPSGRAIAVAAVLVLLLAAVITILL
ncbi:hypothetical protein [Herbihabitans rhizosphaerae]|uniref:hypothetical protein n=1 Tax=Herbihabitans rhizosphaerae TaxID=1872711 RepID=UPI0013EE6162|nr:hypothetical protein [Herbihabitans rhizosphaerae]